MKALAITSGKGGVGKSNVAVNMGMRLVKQGKRVLLFDADMGLANVDVLLGISCSHTLSHVVSGEKDMSEVLVDAPGGLKLLPAGSGVLKLERMSDAQRFRLAKELQTLADSFDVLLVDTGAGMSENVLFFCRIVDAVLLVTNPEPTALVDTYALIKVLSRSPALGPLALVVNSVPSHARGAEVHQKVAAACEKFLERRLGFAGALQKDEALERAVAERKPVVQSHPGAPVSRDFEALAADVAKFLELAESRFMSGSWQHPAAPQTRRA